MKTVAALSSETAEHYNDKRLFSERWCCVMAYEYRDQCLSEHRLFGYEYVQGYTSALLDVMCTLANIDEDLRRHKRRRTAQTYQAIVQTMLDHRVALREHPDAFIRCNDKAPTGFELWFNGKKE